MKRSKFKQLVASLLLGAMLVGGTSAFAAKGNPADPPVDVYVDQVYNTTPKAAKPSNYAEQHNPNKSRIKNVHVGWFTNGIAVGQDDSYLHVSWTGKKNAKKNIKFYEAQVSLGKGYAVSEFVSTKKNSFTLNSRCSCVFKPNLRPSKHNTYMIRVRAVYKKGKPSKWSKTMRFTPTENNRMSSDEIYKITKYK